MNSGSLRPLLVAAILAFLPVVAGAATPMEGPAQFIRTLAADAIEVLQSKDVSLAERQTKFHTLLKERFAVRTIGRFVLGRYWRRTTPEQRGEYFELFADWIAKTYAVRFGGYTNERFDVTGTRVNPGDGDVFVGTRIAKPDSSVAYKANWRVRQINGSYKIIDVVVEGISMAMTQRAEFSSVTRREGIDGLLNILRQRIDEIDRDGR